VSPDEGASLSSQAGWANKVDEPTQLVKATIRTSERRSRILIDLAKRDRSGAAILVAGDGKFK
jgi:hypothetical protein